MIAFRVARLAKVGVDDVLAGRFPPPGTCPHCGAPGTNLGGLPVLRELGVQHVDQASDVRP